MTNNPYSPPAANFESTPVAEQAPPLWNPNVCGVLSFFLSPVFGSIINMKNWRALGEPEKAAQSKLWAIGTIIFYLVLIVASVALPESGPINIIARFAGLGYFIAWYMASCKDMKDVVSYRYGTAFPKRGWGMPILYAFGAYILFFILVGIAAFVFAFFTHTS